MSVKFDWIIMSEKAFDWPINFEYEAKDWAFDVNKSTAKEILQAVFFAKTSDKILKDVNIVTLQFVW